MMKARLDRLTEDITTEYRVRLDRALTPGERNAIACAAEVALNWIHTEHRLRPRPETAVFDGDDHLGVWVALCPVYNDPAESVNCPFCWRFWGEEKSCEIRHYERNSDPRPGEMHAIDRAFYELTVAQRDRAWDEARRLRDALEELRMKVGS